MAIMTASPSISTISYSGNSPKSGKMSWTKPTVPSEATISSCKLTGTCVVSASSRQVTVKVNETTVANKANSGNYNFEIDLGTSNNTTSVTVTATGSQKQASGTVSFSNLDYTVTYEEAAAPKPTYTVTFKDWDGKTLETQTVEEGASVTAPSNPSRVGYNFTGWDKSFNNITANITITAQYSIKTYTVIFKDHDGSTLKTQTVNHGSAATAPSNPTRDGYEFTGWDVSFSNVTSDIIVTAQYKEIREEHLIARYITNASGVVPDFNTGYQYEINETESDGIYTVEITSEEDFSTFKFRTNNTKLIGIEYLNVTSAVTSLDSSFYGCTKLQYINGIDKWDISNSSLTRMYNLFNYCSSLSTIDFSSLNNHNINMMMSAFNGCNSLTFVNLDGFINSSVTDISYLFFDCSRLETIIMNNCDLSNATVSSSFSMNTRSLKNIEMKNTNYTSVNKVISDLPTRTSEDPGTLNIEGVDDFNQVDITTAESKFWNVVSGESEEDIIEWTGLGTVASDLKAHAGDDDYSHDTYKINLDWNNESFDVIITGELNRNNSYYYNLGDIGDIEIGDNKFSIIFSDGTITIYNNKTDDILEYYNPDYISFPFVVSFIKNGIYVKSSTPTGEYSTPEFFPGSENMYELNQPIYLIDDGLIHSSVSSQENPNYNIIFDLAVSEISNEEPETPDEPEGASSFMFNGMPINIMFLGEDKIIAIFMGDNKLF